MSLTKKKTSEKVTLKIPRPLYDKIATVIDDAGYNSVTDFVVYVLRDLVATHEVVSEKPLGTTEINLVKQRLKSLGYL